ncbi:ABC transport system permease protein p69 [Mycoplasmopsis columbina SF7]|uniref:ABC transport system permease protein p69 n=1 Tax=Mycoplasmopsis columbina SF7 TaxID=1037410 RepID=F9UJ96_9BACT|nr:ABC transporter permease subunit [Mycoplasmopsis columbina]EGV00539.1 ABC transport system permease protein p69 [Mycoplasmopsis columbina SF7]
MLKIKQFLHKILFYRYEGKNSATTYKLRSIYKRLLIFFSVAIIIYLFATLDWSLHNNEFGQKTFINNLKNLFRPINQSTYGADELKNNLWLYSFKLLFDTLKYSIAGTFIGFLLATLTALGTNRQFTNKIYSFFARGIMLFLRAIPELIFIMLFTMVFESGKALLLIFMWFSWLWLHKYYIEIVQNIDPTPFYVSLNQGNSKFHAFRKEIFPRIVNRYISLFLYSTESNMRWASILATLGATGIGVLINHGASVTANFNQLLIPLIVLSSAIIILEILNLILKKYLFESKSQKINFEKIKKNDLALYEQLAKKKNWKFIIKTILLLTISLFSIYVFVEVGNAYKNLFQLQNFFKAWFNPDWSVFDLTSSDITLNPFLQILQSFKFAILSLTLTIVTTFILLPFCSVKINNLYAAIFTRIFNSILRVIPSLVYFYIFNPIFTSPLFLLILILGLNETTSLVKQLWEAIDNVDEEILKSLKLQGYSKFYIYRHYMLPAIKNDYLSLLLLYFEIAFRNSITYSVFSYNELVIGSKIQEYLNPLAFRPYKAMAYIWVATWTIFAINVFSSFIINHYLKGKKDGDFILLYSWIRKHINLLIQKKKQKMQLVK